MSGVHDFVRQSDAQFSAPVQSPRPDRLALAEKARVSTKKKDRSSKGLNTLPSTAPAPGYTSNANAARNTHPNYSHTRQAPIENIQGRASPDLRYLAQENGQIRALNSDHNEEFDDEAKGPGIFDETGHDLENTTTDFGLTAVQSQGEYNPYAPEDQDFVDGDDNRAIDENTRHADYTQHHGEAEPFRAPIQRTKDLQHRPHAAAKPILLESDVRDRDQWDGLRSIAGRFTPGRDRSERASQAANLSIKGSNKRERSGARMSRTEHHGSDEHSVEGDDDCGQSGPQTYPAGASQQTGHNDFKRGGNNAALESSPGRPQDGFNKDLLPPQQPELGPDHSTAELKNMDYQDLANEAWDIDPHDKPQVQSTPPERAPESIKDRFERILKEEEIDNQYAIVKTLSMEEWEQTGELFIDRFGELMKKMIKARQDKRALVYEFEKKIEERERLIRTKSVKLEKNLLDMKKGGEGVLRGKLSQTA